VAPKFLNLWGLKESNNNEAYDKGLISELTSNEAISEVISDLCSVVSFIVLYLIFEFTTNIRTLELTHVLGTISSISPIPMPHGRKERLKIQIISSGSIFPNKPTSMILQIKRLRVYRRKTTVDPDKN